MECKKETLMKLGISKMAGILRLVENTMYIPYPRRNANGGGNTHNMLLLALLTKHPGLRKMIGLFWG